MRSPLAELLSDLAGALGEVKVRWYLFGAQAAILLGAARLTADVDVTLEDVPRLSETLLPVLEARGFEPRVENVQEFVGRTRVIPVAHVASGIPVDLVLAGPGLEEQFFTRLTVRRVEDVDVPVASAEDIVVMKILAGRPKDVEDAVAILAANPHLEHTHIRATLRQLEQAIDQSDLLPLFEQALARSRS